MSDYLAPIFDNIPPELKQATNWVCWRAETKEAGKPQSKIPYDAKTQNSRAKSTDPSTWCSFEEAVTAYEERLGEQNPFTGIGFVLSADNRIAGVDIDDCIDTDGELDLQAQHLLQRLKPAYIERSPSGAGVRAFGYADNLTSGAMRKTDTIGIELYTQGRYLTLTGHAIEQGALRELSDFAVIANELRGRSTDKPAVPMQRASATAQELATIVEAIPNPGADYDKWLKIGMALHHETQGSEAGYTLWLEWSSKADCHNAAEMPAKWCSFGKNHGLKPCTIGTLKHYAASAGAGFWPDVTFVDDTDWEDDAEPSKNAPHPLTAFKDLGQKLTPPAWLIRGVVAEGVALFAGGHGVGKTTTIAPLAMGTAGIHYDGWELAPPPEQWRHVVYITEDAPQVERIIQGYVGDIALNRDESPEALQALVRERFHLVEGVRMEAAQIVPAAPYYRKRFTRIVETVGVDGRARSVELLPLVVIDTIAATIQLDNENDNSEVSKAIAVLKQEFEGLPTWLIGHTAKANIGRTDGITARGASAWEADVNQVLYLLKEEKAPYQRVLQLGKRRFEAPHDVFDITSECSTALTVNRFGESELLTLRWATIAVGKIRHTLQAAKEEQRAADKAALRQSIIDAVQAAFDRGERLNSTAICNAIGGKKQAVVDEIKALQDEGRLLEVGIPRGRALQPSRNRFFVPLSDEEREAFKETGEIPEAKNAIPPSWCKPEKTAPNDAAESGDAAPEEQPEMPAEAAA